MKKYEIEFLGNKEICLEECSYDFHMRIEKCNQFIELIASKDRQFFRNDENGFISKFIMIDGKLAFLDHFSQKPIFKTHKESSYDWKGDFNGGGTLQNLVTYLTIFIKSGIPFFHWFARMENWGYESESVAELKEFGLHYGIFAKEKRLMFWIHGKSDIEKVNNVITSYSIHYTKLYDLEISGFSLRKLFTFSISDLP